MEKDHLYETKFEASYFKPWTILIAMVAVTLVITMPLSGNGFLALLSQKWFYHAFVHAFGTIGFLFLFVIGITWLLDRRYPWNSQFWKRLLLQTALAWFAPAAVFAVVLKLGIGLLLTIAVFVNVAYILAYLYCLIGYLKLVNELNTIKQAGAGRPMYFVVKDGEGKLKVPLDEIAYIFSYGKHVFLKRISGLSHVVEMSLDEIARILSQDQFFRPCRDYIVFHAGFVGWEKYDGKRITLTLRPSTDNGPVVVSRSKVAQAKKWMAQDPAVFKPC